MIDAPTLEDVDQFAIPEAPDPAFAEGFGDLSVHVVAVDPRTRALPTCRTTPAPWLRPRIQCSGLPYDPATPPADTSTCELVEVGSYFDPTGNNFSGVETFVDENPDSPYVGRR